MPPQRAESTPTASLSQSEDTLGSSSVYSDEEEDDEDVIEASSDEDEQESPEDYCKGKRHVRCRHLSAILTTHERTGVDLTITLTNSPLGFKE